MADPCQQCSCIPYENICCCPPQSGISVLQPKCLVLPNGTVVNNPCYNQASNTSYWAYKFFTDCTPGESVSAISNFLIPVCVNIQAAGVIVEEKIDGCGQFLRVPFSLNTFDGNFGNAPSIFQWLKVENTNPQRYEKGVCVEYRIGITGNYPAATQAIRVKAGDNRLAFCGTNPCFLVPSCVAPGQLSVEKTASVLVANNRATLHYNVTVTNTGGMPLSNVQFSDEITYNPANLTLGTPTIVPSPPLSSTSAPGRIVISGIIGTINPDETFTATYDIPVTNIASPGVFTVENTATAAAVGTTDSQTLSAAIEAVRLSGIKCCTPVMNGNAAAFIVGASSVGASPETQVNIVDQIIIPPGVTVQFTDFDGCMAVFQGDGTVPLDTNITNAVINITCSNVTVPALGSTFRTIRFTVISTSAFSGVASITNTLQQITGLNNNQIYFTPANVPATASISVTGTVRCNNECTAT